MAPSPFWTRLAWAALLAAGVVQSPAQAWERTGLLERLRGGGAGERSELEDEGAFSARGGSGSLPAGARLEQDIAYGDDPAQRYDVYIPARVDPRKPVIFMVHGGAWMVGDKAASKVVANKVARWLPQGHLFISTNYRLLPKAGPLEQARDVRRALAHAQSRVGQWGGDASRFLLMGHSAGAHLVSLVSSTPELALQQGIRPWLGTVSLDSASMNVVSTMEDKHYRFYDKVFGADRQFWRDASPWHQLVRSPAPFMLVCSTRRDDACPQAQAFADKVRSLGSRASVLRLPLKHGDINGDLGEAGDFTQQVESFIASVAHPTDSGTFGR